MERIAKLWLLVWSLLAMVVGGACRSEAPPTLVAPAVLPASSDNGLVPVYDFAERIRTANGRGTISTIEFGNPKHGRYIGCGWAGPESHDNKPELKFAWATATHAEVELYLLRTDFRSLTFRCWPLTWEGAPRQRLEITINGIRVGSKRLRPGLRRYSLGVPGRALRYGKNRVSLDFSYATSPSDLHPARDDPRTLAAAFVSLGLDQTRPGQEPMAAGRRRGGDLEIPVGASLIYSVAVSEGTLLDVGFATPEGAARGELWLQTEQSRAVTVFDTAAHRALPQRWQIDLGAFSGQTIEIGFTTSGPSSSGADGPIRWRAPHLSARKDIADTLTSVILIVVDTLRADHLSCYGTRASTPNIDALAAAGVRFERAYSQIPITGPSHSTLFTSLMPLQHGVRNNIQVLAEEHTTLAETLVSHNRRTAAFVSLGVLRREYGTAQGFEEYVSAYSLSWQAKADEVNAEVLPWLKKIGPEPIFLWVHYSDPHEPYAPPGQDYPRVAVSCRGKPVGSVVVEGRRVEIRVELESGPNVLDLAAEAHCERAIGWRDWRITGSHCEIEPVSGFTAVASGPGAPRLFTTKLPASLVITNPGPARRGRLRVTLLEMLDIAESRRRYAQEVEFVDQQVGRLIARIKAQGRWENSLIIFVSDHGEGLGEHGNMGHVSQLYEALLRVPMILVWPARLATGQVVETPVSLLDVYPTVLDLLRIPIPANLAGTSMVPLLDGSDQTLPILAETYRPESPKDRQAVIAAGFKYIRTGSGETASEELFDLGSDPGEVKNLARRDPERLARMARMIAEWLAATEANQAPDADLSEEERAHLRAIGYAH